MKIPVKILLTDITELPEGLTWGDVITNWEAYMLEWQEAGILGVQQTELPILDVFQDEGITLKQILKEVTDPKMLFTDYSKSFTVPASKKNNKLFKHYYNIDIDNGFDARQLVSAKLLINQEVYKVGNIALESVKMSMGKPMSYTIRFYGKLSELGKSIGQDKLSDLPLITLSSFNKKTQFTNTSKNDIVFPLSSRFNRFKYGATINDFDSVDKTKAINYISSTANNGNYGIEPNDILGAAKVGWLLDQIESQYGITFAGAITQNYVQDLYLWLTNQEADQNAAFNAFAPSLSPTSSGYAGVSISGGSITFAYVSPSISYNVRTKATWAGTGVLEIYKNGALAASISTSNTFTADLLIDFYSTLTFKWSGATSQTINLTVEVESNQDFSTETYTDSFLVNSTADYPVKDVIPQMGVLEFLGAIFKLFNIVAIVQDDFTINTYHYDSFMATGTVKEITKYVDVSSYDVSVPNFYSGVHFEHEFAGTAIEEGYLTTSSKHYGELIYDQQTAAGNRLNGKPYEFKSKINVLPIEHITNGTTLTNILHTYFGDTSLNEKAVKAAFTYVQPSALVGVAWDNGSTVSSISSYLMPTNLYDPLHSYSTTSFLNGLYWGEELRDFNPSTNVAGLGLYNSFYRGLVNSIFDEDKRLVSVEAYLPQGFIKNFSLADTLTINGNFFNVSEMQTNYMTGKTEMKLIQVGKARLDNWRVRTASATNGTGATVYYTYVNSSGYLTSSSVANGASTTFDCIGDVLRVSKSALTFSYV